MREDDLLGFLVFGKLARIARGDAPIERRETDALGAGNFHTPEDTELLRSSVLVGVANAKANPKIIETASMIAATFLVASALLISIFYRTCEKEQTKSTRASMRHSSGARFCSVIP